MSQLYSFIRRKRRGQPAPAEFVCPHCGRLAGAIVPAETVQPLPAVPVLAENPEPAPVAPVVEPVKISKPKKSRGNAAKN